MDQREERERERRETREGREREKITGVGEIQSLDFFTNMAKTFFDRRPYSFWHSEIERH
jgi:hypothetical protein